MKENENFVTEKVTDEMIRGYYENAKAQINRNIIFYEEKISRLNANRPTLDKNLPLKYYALIGGGVGVVTTLLYQTSSFNVTLPSYAPLVMGATFAGIVSVCGLLWDIKNNVSYHIRKSIFEDKLKNDNNALHNAKMRYNAILRQEEELFKK